MFKCLRPLWQWQMDLCFLNNVFLKSKCLLYKNTRKTPKVQMNILDFQKNTNYMHHLESSCHESQNNVFPWWRTMEMNHHSLGKLFDAETKLFWPPPPSPPKEISRTRQTFWLFLKWQTIKRLLWGFKQNFSHVAFKGSGLLLLKEQRLLTQSPSCVWLFVWAHGL